jgi:[calcium/calmodulin-dependent protein kinase] kinase
MDIKCALTSLNISMALKIVVKLLYLAKKARRKIALKK